MNEPGGKEINCWMKPKHPNLEECSVVKSPLRMKDAAASTQGIFQNVQLVREASGSQGKLLLMTS